jgi:hypothetical protein
VIRVAITRYPIGGRELTNWFNMPAVPRVGETFFLPELFNEPAREVTHVAWAEDEDTGVWHAEVSVR